VPGASCGRRVEEEVSGQKVVDCADLGEGPGEGFGNCVGGAESGDGDC
jgi:hypothetical protein